MSTEKIDEQLIGFLQQHPEFFTGSKEEQSIRQDLRTAVETYARAIDPGAYERLSQRVLEFQAYSRARLKERIADLVKEKERHSQTLREVEQEFEAFERKVNELHDELRRYRAAGKKSASNTGKKGNRDFLFFVIDIIGIAFLYAGFILNEDIEYSLVFLGCAFFAAGFWLHRGTPAKSTAAVEFSDNLSNSIQSRLDKLQDRWKIKKLSLSQKKSVSIRQIELIDQEIRQYLKEMSLNSDSS